MAKDEFDKLVEKHFPNISHEPGESAEGKWVYHVVTRAELEKAIIHPAY